MRVSVALAVVLNVTALFLAGPSHGADPGDVVINELYVNAHAYNDNSEYIELYNTTGDVIDLSGWVLTGTEFDEFCGEHHHEIPPGVAISPYGCLLVARDVLGTDGFESQFGFLPDLEMYDSDQYYETDDLRVPNTICLNPDVFDDQIRLLPGTNDYGIRCSEDHNSYEALFLYTDATLVNLIDAVEYLDPQWCSQDLCLGVNISDSDAYRGIPDEGLCLGRDELSTDSDNSDADFCCAYPTPGAQNPERAGIDLERSQGDLEVQLVMTSNPCRTRPTIVFAIPRTAHVEMLIYTVKGQEIRQILNEVIAAGEHTVVWDGTDCHGREVPAGVYFCRIKAGARVATEKIVFVK